MPFKGLTRIFDASIVAPKAPLNHGFPLKEGSKGNVVPLKGATDGKVIDSSMARRMQFEGRMGSPCGRIFRKSDYGVPLSAPIFDMPRHKWTKLL